jgi:predicted PurR-regulated permease PerM
LLSTLGGLAMFGINGFVMGPLVAALFMAFWGIFIREFSEEQTTTETKPSGLATESQQSEPDDRG